MVAQRTLTPYVRVRILLPLPSRVTKIDTLTRNPWEIRGFGVFIPRFFKACFIDTQGHLGVSGRIWTQFSADLACFMAGFTLSVTFYCSSFLNNLKLFIEEVGIIFWYQPLFSLFWKYEHNPHLAFDSEHQPALHVDGNCNDFWKEYCFFLFKAL